MQPRLLGPQGALQPFQGANGGLLLFAAGLNRAAPFLQFEPVDIETAAAFGGLFGRRGRPASVGKPHVQRYEEEALLLSYTVDFGFLDHVAVPLLRSTGARVTAVGDVAMAGFDPRSAPRAGRAFNSAYAQCAVATRAEMEVVAGIDIQLEIGSGSEDRKL